MPENNIPQKDGEITIADLYPDLTPEQQAEAEYHLLRYLAVVRTIFERIAKENPELLTELKRRAMLRKKRSRFRNS
jgi:RIO-like serine/threonine protein kinase